MEKVINPANLDYFAYVSMDVCRTPVRGVVISFPGLNGVDTFPDGTDEARYFGEKHILFIYPFSNPWAWMNHQTREFADALVETVYEKYQLGDIPLVSAGGSMGGLGAIVYMAYAKKVPVACVANCPVCDLLDLYYSHPNLPSSIYSAFYYEEGSLQDAMKSSSPLHLVGKLPHVPYAVYHCGDDQAVDIERNSAAFVAAMEKEGYDILFVRDEGRPHCDLSPEVLQAYNDSIEAAVCQASAL